MFEVTREYEHQTGIPQVPSFSIPNGNGVALFLQPLADATVVTRHPVEDGVIRNGQFITFQDSLKLFKSMSKTENVQGFIQANVLVDNDDYLVWHTPSQTRSMWFRVQASKPRRNLVKWPNLLFKVSKSGNQFYVFALASSTRPTLTTPIYLAPLMNISDDGSLCRGTAEFRGQVIPENIDKFESVVFNSNFTHVNYRNVGSSFYTDNQEHMRFWLNKDKSQSRVYAREMIRSGYLGDIL